MQRETIEREEEEWGCCCGVRSQTTDLTNFNPAKPPEEIRGVDEMGEVEKEGHSLPTRAVMHVSQGTMAIERLMQTPRALHMS